MNNTQDTGVVVDFHAHLVPNDVISEAENHPDTYSLRVDRNENGLPVLSFDDGVRTRPLTVRLTDAESRIHEMDDDGTDVQVISTWMDLVGYWITDSRALTRWARLQNDGLLEVARRWPERFRVLGTLPLPDITQSVAEVRRLADNGIRGVQLSGHILSSELDDVGLYRLWGELQEHRMVIWLHPHHIEPPPRLDRFFLHNLIGNPLDTTIGVARLIFGGVLDKFPHLRFALAHGGGYLPYQVFRLDRGRQVRLECQQIDNYPSDYLDRFFFDTILFDHRSLRYLGEIVGHDRLLYGTDSPFDLGDPHSRARVSAAFDGDSKIVKHVLGQNALKLLGDPQT